MKDCYIANFNHLTAHGVTSITAKNVAIYRSILLGKRVYPHSADLVLPCKYEVSFAFQVTNTMRNVVEVMGGSYPNFKDYLKDVPLMLFLAHRNRASSIHLY